MAIVAGAVLRLIWVGDIEYKGDEDYTFQLVREIREGKCLPSVGMPSSKAVLNPGLSLWVFVPLAAALRLAEIRTNWLRSSR